MGVLQVFEKFYETLSGDSSPKPGHMYWVPTPNIDEVPRILEVERATPTEHEVSNFMISEVGNTHFKSRSRLPIKRLALGDTEEIIVSKAKKRLVVVIATITSEGIATLPSGTQHRLAQHLAKPSYLVAPLFSTSNIMEPGTFGPALVARIRALQYPHFFCLPDEQRPDRPRSIIRLDRVFPTFLGRGSEPANQKIHDEPFEVILSQFSILCGGASSEAYELIRELVQDALPDELS